LAHSLNRRRFFRASIAGVALLSGCFVRPKGTPTGSGRVVGSGGSSVGVPPTPSVRNPTLTRAVDWLLARQALPEPRNSVAAPVAGAKLPADRDGGWHSTKYAQLRSGQALTPLVTRALVLAGTWDRPMSWSEHFIREHVDANGALGAHDPEFLEYPNYATALGVLGLSDDPSNEGVRRRMVAYLVDQQYREAGGFGPEHVAYGGWGFGGKLPLGGSPGHMDLAHTRHVLEALRAAGHDDPETYRRAERFLRLVQKHPTEDREHPSLRNGSPSRRARSDGDGSSSSELATAKTRPPYDGGFYFSPVVLAANKAGEAEHDGRPYFRSYATATCEGILALLACGVQRDDERIRAAVGRLGKHPRLDYPEGIPEDQHENWGASIRYYHFAVRAQCYAALDWSGDWRRELRDELARRQESDGSFVNREGILMKEDDPILCTALAVLALGFAQQE